MNLFYLKETAGLLLEKHDDAGKSTRQKPKNTVTRYSESKQLPGFSCSVHAIKFNMEV